MKSKKELRRWIREQKRAFPDDERSKLSEALCREIASCPLWEEAHTVLLYHPLPDEVDTRLLIASATTAGKRVLLPVVNGEDLLLRIFTGNTTTGRFSIEEPTGPLFTDYALIDLALIPGMAFDRDRNRLGRGKGYYDRLLPRLTHARRWGICFPFQMVEALPADAHDVPVDVVFY